MTDTPELPDWTKQPLYPSSLFGGTRGEVWTPEEVGGLYLGWMMLADGLTTLRGLIDTPTDAPDADRTDVLNEATEWMAGAGQWMNLIVEKDKDKLSTTDRGEILAEIIDNVSFLLESVGEHTHRLGYGPE